MLLSTMSFSFYLAFRFSDILTPLPGMGVNFDILEKEGPVIAEPVRTMEDVQKVRKLDPAVSMPFVGETLRILRSKVPPGRRWSENRTRTPLVFWVLCN